MAHKDFISLHDYTTAEIKELFELAAKVKADKDAYRQVCAGKPLGPADALEQYLAKL